MFVANNLMTMNNFYNFRSGMGRYTVSDFCFLTGLIILAIMSVWYFPSSGGEGISLPFNLLFMAATGLMLVGIARCCSGFVVVPPKRFGFIFSGLCVFMLPWLLNIERAPGILVVAGGALIWWILQGCVFTYRLRRRVLLAIFLLAVVQAMVGLVQTFLPDAALHWYEYNWLRNHGRPYGIFQQVNLLGSFLATGVGCGLWLALTTQDRAVNLRGMAARVGLGIIVFTLFVAQSRVGIIGFLSIVVIILWLVGINKPRRLVDILILMIFCGLAGWWVSCHFSVRINGELWPLARSYSESNAQRWKILDITMRMIMMKPLEGWGYGTFEHEFMGYVNMHPEMSVKSLGMSNITHPHNEFLYVWFQGGVIPVLGLLLMIIGWFKNIAEAMKKNRESAANSLLIVPLLVHLNLEYPFYQSFIHFGTFILLLRLSAIEKEPESISYYMIYRARKSMIFALGIGLVVYCISALYANNSLTRLERTGFEGFPERQPWYFATQPERVRFDAMIALLISYNELHDEKILDQFMTQAYEWLKYHNDPNVLRSMIRILQHKGDIEGEKQLSKQYLHYMQTGFLKPEDN